MIVVSDASVIINLAAVGQLSVLKHLYTRVLIPRAVYEEIAVVGSGLPGAREVKTHDWIEAREVKDVGLVDALLLELDRGEAEAIALAREARSDLLLIDERRGRAVADRFGVPKIGLLGVLVQGRRQGAVTELRPVLGALRDHAGFWVGDALLQRVLEEVGEA